MVLFPNCKINIGLHVLSRRDDGYHNISTLIYPIKGWHDALEAVESAEFQFEQEGIVIPGDKSTNICVKAYRLLQENYDIPPVHLFLLKDIPPGAGLGGGSSDGAFTLRLLDKLYSLNLGDEEFMVMAAKLGSDCPFFIHNVPAMASGRGEVLQKIDIDLSAYYIAIVYPGIHIDTGKAYSKVTPGEMVVQLPSHDPRSWRGEVTNDFEEIVMADHPKMKDIKDHLYKQGALYASLSGSGSAVYGIFGKEPDRERLIKDLQVEHVFVGRLNK